MPDNREQPDTPPAEPLSPFRPPSATEEAAAPPSEPSALIEETAQDEVVLAPEPIETETVSVSADSEGATGAADPSLTEIEPEPALTEPPAAVSLPDSTVLSDAATAQPEATVAESAEPEASSGEGELEEWIEPLEETTALEPREPGSVLTLPDGSVLRITELLRSDVHAHLYAAAGEDEKQLRLYEARDEEVCQRHTGPTTGAARLRHEAEVLSGLDSRLFPRPVALFESEGRVCLAVEPIPSDETLADLLSVDDPPISQTLSVLAQVAFALKQLHQHGWVHLGIRPSVIALGRPVRVTDLSYATRIGERPSAPFYHAGYSPPELLSDDPVTPAADIYGVGALLYHAVNGKPIGEAGAELGLWSPPNPIAGVPQILHRCLGPRQKRYASMDELHRDLIKLAKRTAPSLRYALAAATSIGLEPSRTANEDAYATLTGQMETENGPESWAALCVADGMGGMAAGEVASEAAVRAVLSQAATAFMGKQGMSVEEQAQTVKSWIHSANESAVGAMNSADARGGCTLACASLIGRRLTAAHVGDCRIYRICGQEVTPLTRDHSLVMSLVLQGEITTEEIRTHPERSKITRSLGERHPLPDYYPDTLQQATGSLSLELEPGDVLLLCSDGLWEPVLEEEMREAVQGSAPDLNAAAHRLVELALERGGPDNITLVLLRLDLQ